MCLIYYVLSLVLGTVSFIHITQAVQVLQQPNPFTTKVLNAQDTLAVKLPSEQVEGSIACLYIYHSFTGKSTLENCGSFDNFEVPAYHFDQSVPADALNDDDRRWFQVITVYASFDRKWKVHSITVWIQPISDTASDNSETSTVQADGVETPSMVILWPPYTSQTSETVIPLRYLTFGFAVPIQGAFIANTHKKDVKPVSFRDGQTCLPLSVYTPTICKGIIEISALMPGTHAISFTILQKGVSSLSVSIPSAQPSMLPLVHTIFDHVPSETVYHPKYTTFGKRQYTADRSFSSNDSGETVRDPLSHSDGNHPLSGKLVGKKDPETKKNISLVYVGTLTLDGQRTIWAAQIKGLRGYDVRYVSFHVNQQERHDETRSKAFEKLLDRAALTEMMLAPIELRSNSSVHSSVSELARVVGLVAAIGSTERRTPNQCDHLSFSILSMLLPRWGSRFVLQVCGALCGAEIVVFGNSMGISDAVIASCSKFVGAKSVMDLPNLFPNEEVRVSMVVAPSQYAASHWSITELNPEALAVIHPGIEVGNFSPTTPNGCGQKQSTSKFVVGYVGRLAPEKSVGILLHAAYEVANQYPKANIEFVIVGAGPMSEPLLEMARLLGILQDSSKQKNVQVKFTGKLQGEQLRSQMSKFDVLVNPSLRADSETFCIVNIEAMALGIPIISFGAGGVSDYLVHRFNSVIVRLPSELPVAIWDLLQNPKKRCEYARQALSDVHEAFTSQRMLSDYDSLFRSLLEKKH